jgi:hypothetical protein
MMHRRVAFGLETHQQAKIANGSMLDRTGAQPRASCRRREGAAARSRE